MFDRVIEIINSCSTFLITSHIRPDGDALGSELAIYHLLRDMGKEAVVYNQDKTPIIYEFLPGSSNIIHSLNSVNGFDAAFVLDCSDIERVGDENDRIGSVKQIINIDHHVSVGTFSDILILDSTASSTGEIIHRLLKYMGATISEEIATNIYTAILTDTGSFRYSNTGSNTFAAAADLVENGANCRYIAEKIYETRSAVQIRLMGKTLETLELFAGGKIGFICISQKTLRREGALPEHTEGFVDIVRSIQGIEIAICCYEVSKDRFKVSLRSKGNVDVEQIAARLGGGGHINASACRINGDIKAVKTAVLNVIETVYKAL
ncbi:MAG: bifunctional oligoribonuclease/PAP phosphatase NrnA [Thermodesulfobacteriota bacterium]|nr:bifunctional oligoribonuclease/PAP phosphatase NrnA [Thermodesulfobacteriota bacterium]